MKPTLDRFFARAFALRDRLGEDSKGRQQPQAAAKVSEASGGAQQQPALAPAPAVAAAAAAVVVRPTGARDTVAALGSPAAEGGRAPVAVAAEGMAGGGGGAGAAAGAAVGPAAAAGAAGAAQGRTSQTMACCLFSFEAQQDGDLSFLAGDILQLTTPPDMNRNWWRGHVHSQPEVQGVFPRNFVELLRRGACRHDFSPENDDELELKRDQNVLIISGECACGTIASARASTRVTCSAGPIARVGQAETQFAHLDMPFVRHAEPEKDWFRGFVEGKPAAVGLFPATFLALS
eukprot:SAG22_NODE_57_length_23647_cov_11.746688_9_plen_291_part_00